MTEIDGTIKLEEEAQESSKIDDQIVSNFVIKEEEGPEKDIKGCYIWFSETNEPNFLAETPMLVTPRGKKIKKKSCAVKGCMNIRVAPTSDMSFHRFPSDEGRRAIWIQLCGRTDGFNENNSFICSAHFRPEDFVKINPRYSVSVKNKNRLVSDAIPSLNLPKCAIPDLDPTSYNGSPMTDKTKALSDDDSLEIITEEHDVILVSSSEDEDDTKENEIYKKNLSILQKRLIDRSSLSSSMEEENPLKVLKLNNMHNFPLSKSEHRKPLKIEQEPTAKPSPKKSEKLDPLKFVKLIPEKNMKLGPEKSVKLSPVTYGKSSQGKSEKSISQKPIKLGSETSMKLSPMTYGKLSPEKSMKLSPRTYGKLSLTKSKMLSPEKSLNSIPGKSEMVVVLSSDEDDIEDSNPRKEVISHLQLDKDREYDELNQKYRILLDRFEELKSETKADITKLNNIIKAKEEEYSQELREVLSVFLKSEEVECVIKNARW